MTERDSRFRWFVIAKDRGGLYNEKNGLLRQSLHSFLAMIKKAHVHGTQLTCVFFDCRAALSVYNDREISVSMEITDGIVK
jgi:hypothetical protein